MAETPEKRRLRNERMKARMAADPEYALEVRTARLAAKKRYQDKKKAAKDAARPKLTYRKPGRLVALCGWHGWG